MNRCVSLNWFIDWFMYWNRDCTWYQSRYIHIYISIFSYFKDNIFRSVYRPLNFVIKSNKWNWKNCSLPYTWISSKFTIIYSPHNITVTFRHNLQLSIRHTISQSHSFQSQQFRSFSPCYNHIAVFILYCGLIN